MTTAPAASPSGPRQPTGDRDRGSRSAITRANIAPAAKANETGRRDFTVSTSTNAIPAPERLRGARQHRGPELLRPAEARISHWDRDARALRNVLQSDRQDDEEAEPRGVRGVRGADRETLRKAVDEEHEEDERRQPHAGAAPRANVNIATAQPEPGDRQECDADSEAERDFYCGALVDRGLEQAQDGRNGHDSRGKSPERRLPVRGPPAEKKDRDRTESSCKGRRGSKGHDRQQLRHRALIKILLVWTAWLQSPAFPSLRPRQNAFAPCWGRRTERSRKRRGPPMRSWPGVSSGTSTPPHAAGVWRRCCSRCWLMRAGPGWMPAG